MLTVDSAPRYLIERGLITISAVVEGDLTITSAVRRNRNLRVTRKEGINFLIKQPEEAQFEGTMTVRREGSFYHFCSRDPAMGPLRAILPKMIGVDPEHNLFVMELVRDCTNLWNHYTGQGALALAQAAGAVGNALGLVHRVTTVSDAEMRRKLTWLSSDLPWIMQIHKPSPELLSTISPANYKILTIIQEQKGISSHLDAVRRLWSRECLIHGDIKSDNVLVLPRQNDSLEIRLIDWELVQLGDPAWDVAGMLQDFILFWINTMSPAATPEEMAENAKMPLQLIQPAIRAFWKAYRKARAWEDPAEPSALLSRAVRFSGARLVQSAFELAQMSHNLPIPSVLLLQISSNLLAEPEDAQVQLFGLFTDYFPWTHSN